MGDNGDKSDPLLEKLDGFLRSGRKHAGRTKPPVLTDALPDEVQGSIPILTNAIEDAAEDEKDHEDQVKDEVASRLIASVNREMAGLLEAYPEFGHKLTLLHRSINFALPQLVRLRWEDADYEADDDATSAQDDAVAADDDSEADGTGTDPDQQP